MPLPENIRDWYRLSENLTTFYASIPHLDVKTLAKTMKADLLVPPRGRLRTRVELEREARAQPPPIETLRMASPREQTLQWMFMHRGYLAETSDKILTREVPTCCAGETRHGAADLLAYDNVNRRPIIVELKRASAGDPLTRCVLEVLWHWTFTVQHIAEFQNQLAEFGCEPVSFIPTLAIAAPESFFRDGRERSRRRGGDEFKTGLSWIVGLCEAEIVKIDLYAIENDWQAIGPEFRIRKL